MMSGESNRRTVTITLLITFAVLSLGAGYLVSREISAAATQQEYLTPEQYGILSDTFRIHINYFLSPQVIPAFGLPLTAYKVGDRARYGYSNPTEWGYALEAWIAAAERGIVSQSEAATKISVALTTMRSLQQNSNQHYHGLFYPYYTVTDLSGNDLPSPVHDANVQIPSGDNALLYTSLLITEGWAKNTGNTSLENLAKSTKDAMEFRIFLRQEQDKMYIAHTITATSGVLSPYNWVVFADEGGVVTWVTFLAGAVTFEEFQSLTESQMRSPATWRSCTGTWYTVREAAWFNAMFTWGVRSLSGFPISSLEAPSGLWPRYSKDSFVPAVEAHLAYGDCLGVDYPGFSDAMTQSDNHQPLVGRYTPPNLQGVVPNDPPHHIVPYAFFIPFNAGPTLGSLTTSRLISEIVQLKSDMAGYYHDSGAYPFGFEIVASPYQDNPSYTGADDGRNVFETLGESFIALSAFNGLELDDGKPTFYEFAALVPGYEDKLRQVIPYLYPPQQSYLPLIVMEPTLTPVPCVAVSEQRFGSGGSQYPEERSITIVRSCLRAGENTVLLENANPSQTDHWVVWDSLNLKTNSGQVIWELGQNEAPPDYSSAAYDEFKQSWPYNPNFYVGQMPVSEFPKEINDHSFSQVYIHFSLTAQQANNDMVLFLDTLYATHDSAPYFDMKVHVTSANGMGTK